jgi:hypothetical protein
LNTLVAFCGYARSGKDTAALVLAEYGYERLAFADALRDSLYALNPIVQVEYALRAQEIVDGIGWDRAKVEYPEIRELLQRFGTEVGRTLYGENFWVDRVMTKVKPGGKYVITDVRFPNEQVAVQQAGGRVFRIQRPNVGAANAHSSEDVSRLMVDGVVPNTGSIEAFRESVLSAVGLK